MKKSANFLHTFANGCLNESKLDKSNSKLVSLSFQISTALIQFVLQWPHVRGRSQITLCNFPDFLTTYLPVVINSYILATTYLPITLYLHLHDLFTFFARIFLTSPQTFFVKPERPKIEKIDKFLRVITVGEGLWTFWPRFAQRTFLNVCSAQKK